MGKKKTIHLTEASVARLQIPKGKDDATWFDDKTKGFGVRKRGDTAVYILQYQLNGKTSKLTLGKCSEIKCDVARAIAQAKRGEIAKARHGFGIDPALARDNAKAEAHKPKPQTVGATMADYLEAIRPAVRPRTYSENKRHLEDFWKPLHNLPLGEVTRANVAAELRKIAKRGPVATNRSRTALSTFFAWAMREGLCDNNPVINTNQQKENAPRTRVLSDAEAAAIWLNAPEGHYGYILKLLLLTGCRRDEIGGLQWSEIDPETRTITIPGTRTKNHTEHVVPLSDAAVAIINDIPRLADRDFVFGFYRNGGFSDWSKSKLRLDEKLKFKEEWIVHDIRRTVRSGLGALSVQPHICEAVINHLPPKLVRTYDVNTYLKEKRAALDLWASHLHAITSSGSLTGIGVRVVAHSQGQPEGRRATFAERLSGKAKKDKG